ncbi:MAG: ABC transporter ATP-binding protein [Clostridia bacterium]|nr:ABC transporter ATP-binding protein [Clostridia bacterium]
MIKAHELTKIFGTKPALDKVSFDIADGSVFGLIGSNGSGKSTLLRLISGIYLPDGGSICIDGAATFDNPVLKSQIAFLGDTPYFLAQSDLSEMTSFYRSLYPNFSKDVFEHMLKIFPLDRKARISSMSKGMQRQAALILAISSCPKYLLMDEAFDGLDVVMRRVLGNILLEGVEQQGLTTVIASHNLRELEDLSDHVGLLHEGKVLFNDRMDSLRGTLHKVQAVFERTPDVSVFKELNVIKTERTGSLVQMIIRGKEDEIMTFIRSLDPIFCECIEPTLEEMFIYELEVTGYDVKNILQ